MDDPADDRAFARRAISLLDLTDLSDAAREPALVRLCESARSAGVAAVCVWPQWVSRATRLLSGSPVRIATVANFPAGGHDVERAVADATEALRDGADEIDLVMPWRHLAAGDDATARVMIGAVRAVADRGRRLKVILETGELAEPTLIRRAADLAIAAGADFIKTSTGKTPVSATPEAAAVMLDAIRDSGRPVGLKPSGGIRTLEDARLYLGLADRIMGPDWATPATFRFGASGLLDILTAMLGQATAP